jgi:hypothetical protein
LLFFINNYLLTSFKIFKSLLLGRYYTLIWVKYGVNCFSSGSFATILGAKGTSVSREIRFSHEKPLNQGFDLIWLNLQRRDNGFLASNCVARFLNSLSFVKFGNLSSLRLNKCYSFMTLTYTCIGSSAVSPKGTAPQRNSYMQTAYIK